MKKVKKNVFVKNIKLGKTLDYLATKKKILFLTTSNRWIENGEKPKSTQLAEKIATVIGRERVVVLDVSSLKIYHCEGNISTSKGNNCGIKQVTLQDKEKNPSGMHRCWASINNSDDELWKVSKALFESDCVVFFGSVRWGQMNAYYQKLIERLSWIENRHSTLGEDNIVQKIDAGIIIVGQNWYGKGVLATQKKVLQFYGFHVIDSLCWNWQFTHDEKDESKSSYTAASQKFELDVLSKIVKK